MGCSNQSQIHSKDMVWRSEISHQPKKTCYNQIRNIMFKEDSIIKVVLESNKVMKSDIKNENLPKILLFILYGTKVDYTLMQGWSLMNY